MEDDLSTSGDIFLEIGDLDKSSAWIITFRGFARIKNRKLEQFVLYLDTLHTAVEHMSTAQVVKLHVYLVILERFQKFQHHLFLNWRKWRMEIFNMTDNKIGYNSNIKNEEFF